MYRFSVFVLFVSINAHAAETKELDGRPITREQFEQLKTIDIDAVSADRDELPGWETPEEYDREPLLRNVDAKELAAVKATVHAYAEPVMGDSVRVTVDMWLPNMREALIRFESVAIAYKGRALKLEADTRNSGMGANHNQVIEAPELAAFDDTKKLSGKTTIEVKVPVEVENIPFDNVSAGATSGGIRIGRSSGRQVYLEGATDVLDGATVIAYNAAGIALSRTGRTGGSPDKMAAFKELQKKSWDQLPAKIELPGTRYFTELTFGGVPVKLVVQRVAKTSTMRFTVPIAFVPAPLPVYARPLERRVCTLDQAKLDKESRVGATRSIAMASYGQPTLFVQLPRCDNALFARGEVDKLVFLDAAGKELRDVEVQHGLIGYEDFADERRFGREGSNDVALPALVKVRAHVRYDVPNLDIVRVTRAKPVGGVKLAVRGAHVELTYPATDERYREAEFGNMLRMHVPYDKAGRALTMTNVSVSRQGATAIATFDAPSPVESVDVILVKPGLVFEKDVTVTMPPAPPPRKE